MRPPRRKQVNRHLALLERAYDFRAPYTVVCDGNFLHIAANKIGARSKSALETFLGSVLENVALEATTAECVLRELRELESTNVASKEEFAATLALASSLRQLRVGSTEEDSLSYTPDAALTKLAGKENRHKYFIATQDEGLRAALRDTVPGLPLLVIQRVTLVLESPSELTIRTSQNKDQQKIRQSIEATKRVMRLPDPRSAPKPGPPPRAFRKVSQPNPLSMKKKKKRPLPPASSESNKRLKPTTTQTQ